jgi:hypothetical protein
MQFFSSRNKAPVDHLQRLLTRATLIGQTDQLRTSGLSPLLTSAA